MQFIQTAAYDPIFWLHHSYIDKGQKLVLFSALRLSHCYYIRLNLKKMGPLQFCLPVFLGIHRNPKQKEIFNSCEGFLK